MSNPRLVLHPRRAQPFYGRHPWVFAGAIASVEGEPANGDEVDLISHADNFVARGLYNSQSKIRARLYSWDPEVPLDEDFFRAQFQRAIQLREQLPGLSGPKSACRLIFSEGDGLSGLTVDRYDRWLVVQITALAMGVRSEMIVDLLRELVQPEGIYLRTERGMRDLEGLDAQDGLMWGAVPEKPIVIEENGVKFHVDLTEGQKTGFYLDQRDNRQVVAQLANGRRVLDAFCYVGGFGLHCAKAGAESVLSIDVSEPALVLAQENATLNEIDNVTFERGDVFTQLQTLAEAGEKFGMVILDPPKFARKRSSLEDAMRGYRRLHVLALQLLEPNGYLVTCCCSGLITMDSLLSQLSQVSSREKRPLQILEQRGQAADHPVSATCLESSYLKCIVCRVL